jgi:hypothetical protein
LNDGTASIVACELSFTSFFRGLRVSAPSSKKGVRFFGGAIRREIRPAALTLLVDYGANTQPSFDISTAMPLLLKQPREQIL